MRETAYISINEIRQLLSDTDYHSDLNQAAITFKVTINTYSIIPIFVSTDILLQNSVVTVTIQNPIKAYNPKNPP